MMTRALICSAHGPQPGRLTVKWCDASIFDSLYKRPVSSLAGVSGREAAPASLPLDLCQDQFQDLGDRFP